MYESLYESFSVYEAKMLLEQDPKEFSRLYRNMRHTLQRRAKTLEKKNRQYTQGYQKIKTALATADGADKAKSFSLISTTVVQKTTKYTGQIEAEKKFANTIKEKYNVKIPKKYEKELFRAIEAIKQTREGQAFYKTNKKGFFKDTIEIVKESKGDYKKVFDKLSELVNGD